jgi:hypothetical protein
MTRNLQLKVGAAGSACRRRRKPAGFQRHWRWIVTQAEENLQFPVTIFGRVPGHVHDAGQQNGAGRGTGTAKAAKYITFTS